MNNHSNQHRRRAQRRHRPRAVSYLRTASKNQSGSSDTRIAVQRAACQAHAARLGATIVAEFSDAGCSGTTTTDRPALAAMLSRLTAGDIDYVIVRSIDRLTRNTADHARLDATIAAAGARLVSAVDGDLPVLSQLILSIVNGHLQPADAPHTTALRRTA